MVNAYIPGRADVGPATAAMIARRDALLGPAYRLMYERPLHIVRGEGAWLIDPEGRRYLDAYNNVTSLGHCHPAVTEAICRQVQTLATNTRYLHDTILELAERLLASVPETELAHLMLTCTGSEANDLAYRIAKVRTGGTGVIVTDTAYHGITDAVSKFSPSLGVTVDLGAHVRLVPAPRLYHAEGADLGERFTPRRRGGDRRSAASRHQAGRADRRFAVHQRRHPPGTRGLPEGRGRCDQAGRRLVHCRRGPARLRPDRRTPLGLSAPWCHARHRHHGQADGQRPTDRGTVGDRRRAGGIREALALLQHVCRQHRLVRGGTGGAGHDRARAAGAACCQGRDDLARRHRRSCRPARGHRRRARRRPVRRGRTRLRSRVASAGSQRSRARWSTGCATRAC